MNVIITFFLLCFSAVSQTTSPGENNSSLQRYQISCKARSLASRDPPPLRKVYAVADISLRSRIFSPLTGDPLLYGHAFLHVEGTPSDGAIRVEQVQPRQNFFVMRVLDFTVENNDQITLASKASMSSVRQTYYVGETRMTNAGFADPTTGKGLVLDIWAKNPIWIQGSNCCNQFVQNMVRALGLHVPLEFDKYVSNAVEYAEHALPSFESRYLPLWITRVNHWGDHNYNEQTAFDTKDPHNPKLMRSATLVDQSAFRADTAVPGDDGLDMPLERPGFSAQPPPIPFNSIEYTEASSSEATFDSDGASSDRTSSVDSSRSLIHANADEAQAVSSVRVGGVAADITVILEKTARAVGVAGVAIAPLFVILDFAQGNPVGGAFGVVGMSLGILALTAVDGPIGWLVGALAALFTILPSLYDQRSVQLPSSRNATEIIQYAMFGDIHHTGNEKCREQNPNCTALYGPGVIGASLGWDNFDPIVFLLHYNHGYAMSLPEIANAFYIIDPSKPGDGADQVATISCHSSRAHCTRWTCPGTQRGICGKSAFTLNRSLVTIPVLNQTADKVYDRMVPKPHGDCKLVNDMAEDRYKDYNITVTGSPAAIACGLTASIVEFPLQNVDGSSAPNISGLNAQNASRSSGEQSSSPSVHKLENTTSQESAHLGHSNSNDTIALINDPNAYNGRPAAMFAPLNMSTDGSSHEVAAPSPTGFLSNPLNFTNAVCLSGSGGSMCFPKGTYSIQTGKFGFDSGKVDSLSLPAGASVSFTVASRSSPRHEPTLQQWRYTTDQPSTSLEFKRNFDRLAATVLGRHTFEIDVPDGPPVACIFSQTQYEGDVTCYGIGRGNVSANVVDVPQSLTLHGNATVWMYGNYYGDDAGQRLAVDTADLSNVPLGVDGNFKQRIKALWVIG